MRDHIVLVGCGFLGSVFTDEYLKRVFAGNLDMPLTFVDCDKWERRNAANQNVSLEEASSESPKSCAMHGRALAFGLDSSFSIDRVTASNIENVLAPAWVVVDAVDNLETRQLLYRYGMENVVPVLHLGISEVGTGAVEWSYPTHDYFSLAPHKAKEDGKRQPTLPPCELVRMRMAGVACGMAGAMALGIYFGFDPNSYVEDFESTRWMTEWGTTPEGFFPRKETWEHVERIEE